MLCLKILVGLLLSLLYGAPSDFALHALFLHLSVGLPSGGKVCLNKFFLFVKLGGRILVKRGLFPGLGRGLLSRRGLLPQLHGLFYCLLRGLPGFGQGNLPLLFLLVNRHKVLIGLEKLLL